MVASDGHIKDFELGLNADTFRMSATPERPVLLRGSFRLHRENSLGDCLDDSLLPGDASLSVATSNSKTSG